MFNGVINTRRSYITTIFSVYIDDLLIKLKISGMDCYMGPLYYGTVLYADDLVLLNPSKNLTKTMLNIK